MAKMLILFLIAASITACAHGEKMVTRSRGGIEDLKRIPQTLTPPAKRAAGRLAMDDNCRKQMLAEFRQRFFAPWTSADPTFETSETVSFMKFTARGKWYGVNKQKVPRQELQRLLDNCDLDSFPSRNDTAIAVAPAHLRGLPTVLPLYEKENDEPFDMLSYPEVKLNEPLRVMHESRDGVWLFVETPYSNGWIERREVALVDQDFIDQWLESPLLVVTRDLAPVSDGKEIAVYPAKIGTLLPLHGEREDGWEVLVASAREGGEAELRQVRLPRESAAPFPVAFNAANIGRVGNQLLGQPYGWGELYDLRDCSALLRDFFMPFGIWLPRTAADQIESVRHREALAKLSPSAKRELIKERGIPFLTLLFKPGHIMLYIGEDEEGRPLVFHDAWSILVQEGEKGRKQIIGAASITTLEPGKELGLAPKSSLLEKITEMATIPERCRKR